MRDSPGSVVTLLCSGIQLYSAERRIADCILNDVKWASVVTSAQLARASQSSEATVTRLCHKLGFDNYRKFQLALARDVMDQQETETQRSTSPDPLRQALQSVQANRQEEVRATIQALNLRQLRKAMSVLRSAELIEVEASDNSLPVAMDASLKLGSLGKRCMTSAVPGRTRAFADTLTERDALLLISNSGRSERLLETARAARERGPRSCSSPATAAPLWPRRQTTCCWPPTGRSASWRPTRSHPCSRRPFWSRCCTTCS